MGIRVAGLLDTTRRIFGYDRIKRALQQRKRDYTKNVRGSIATGNRWGGPHEHKREKAAAKDSIGELDHE